MLRAACLVVLCALQARAISFDTVTLVAQVPVVESAPLTLEQAQLIARTSRNFSHKKLTGLKLVKFRCENCDFDTADLRNADLTGASLAGASFRDARLGAAVFSNADVSGCRFTSSVKPADAPPGEPPVVFVKTRLYNARMEGLSLRGAAFTEADLTAFYAVDCVFDKADFSMAGVSFARKPEKPGDLTARFVSSSLRKATFNRPLFSCLPRERDTVPAVMFLRCALDSTVFISAGLAGARMDSCRLDQCRFDQCNMLGIWISRSSLARAALSGCTAKGAAFVQCAFPGTVMAKTVFDYARFDGSDFTGADLAQAEFFSASFNKVKNIEKAVNADKAVCLTEENCPTKERRR